MGRIEKAQSYLHAVGALRGGRPICHLGGQLC